MTQTANPASAPAPQRLLYLDLFRGLAVLFMFDAHVTDAIVQLGPGASRVHYWHNLMFNLPAPGFLYAAGLSFGMVVYARWEQFQSWGSPVRSRLARLCEVLFVAYLLHVPATSLRRTLYESSERQMRTFLGWDVLQCIGYTLLLLLALAVLMPRRIWFFRSCLALTLMIAFASAWIWKMSWSAPPPPLGMPWWIATVFSKQLGSNFPFFPYAGFLVAGAVWGYLFARSREQNGTHSFFKATLIAGAALLVVCLALTQVALPAPYDDFWSGSPVFFFLRVGLLSVILAALYFLERWLLPALGFLVALGKESLIVYFVHLILVYGSPLNSAWNVHSVFRDGVGFWTWMALLAGMTAAMTVLAYGWSWAKQTWGARLDRALWAGAALATVIFVIR